MTESAVSSTFEPTSEAEVVYWLKKGLRSHGLCDRPVRDIVVDADGSYLSSPFARYLEPVGVARIGSWRPDLVCTVEHVQAELLAGFEVKRLIDLEKGIVQASRYRLGVHEAYLCVPAPIADSPGWLWDAVRDVGIGLVSVSPAGLRIAVESAKVRPDPSALEQTRRYLQGEITIRALNLNKPLHYAAAAVAYAYEPDPRRALMTKWRIGQSIVRDAVRGAEAFGLVAAGSATMQGFAFADVATYLGFDLERSRQLTQQPQLADAAPPLAAAMRAVMVRYPPIDLILRTLAEEADRPITSLELAYQARRRDVGLAQAVFGERAYLPGGEIRESTRYQLKAAMYDVGLLATRLAPGAGSPRAARGYDPELDLWQIAAGVSMHGS